MKPQNFVPYKLSKELRDLGYDEPTKYHWHSSNVDTPFTYQNFLPSDAKPINNSTIKKLGYELDIWSAPTFQDAFDWFEEKYQMFVHRYVDTNVNEILDIDYKIKSWRFTPIDVEFGNPYDCFHNNIARPTCLRKLIDLATEIK
jgi:hypothetical protein